MAHATGAYNPPQLHESSINNKRSASDQDLSPVSPKRRRIAASISRSSAASQRGVSPSPSPRLGLSSSPPTTQTSPQLKQYTNYLGYNSSTLERKVDASESLRARKHIKRSSCLADTEQDNLLLYKYLEGLPNSTEDFAAINEIVKLEDLHNMNPPAVKRPRASDGLTRRTSISDRSIDSLASRDKKYAVYKAVNYTTVLETKNSFMRSSQDGLLDEDEELCKILQTHFQPLPSDPMFSNEHFSKFHQNLRDRSEARIVCDLHSRVMPSIENICIEGRPEFSGLIEGYNDPWVKAIPFFGPRPQPDHTIGFRWFNFTDEQRRKLDIQSATKSLYTAREEIYFPFYTGEVKCGRQGLDLADRPNAHSMTIHMRGVVEIYRRAHRLREIHRRALGFSISHDDKTARLYVHYVELEADEPTYYMKPLSEISFGNNNGQERWSCYRFSLNICELFALPFLERLKNAIDALPDPLESADDLPPIVDDASVQSSQEDISGVESQEENTPKSRQTGIVAELRRVIHSLQQQVELQRKNAEQARQETRGREASLLERESALIIQLEQYRKDVEQQRKDLEQQRATSANQQSKLMDMLSEQSSQIKEQSAQIKEQNSQIKQLLQKH